MRPINVDGHFFGQGDSLQWVFHVPSLMNCGDNGFTE